MYINHNLVSLVGNEDEGELDGEIMAENIVIKTDVETVTVTYDQLQTQ